MGLREQKKRETRERISDVATQLFFERGFDAVTVEEIAAAANVSKMTVFNYFPRKEDLLFDRQAEITTMIRAAVLKRARGESPLAALERLIRHLDEDEHAYARVNPTHATFWALVRRSPSLAARARELGDEAVADLAAALADAAGAKVDATARLLAGMTLTTWRTAYGESIAALPSQKNARAAFLAVIDHGFRAMRVIAKGTKYA